MTFDFHEEALHEYQAAGLRYESKQPGLGVRFTQTIESAIDRILENPGRFRPVAEGIHLFRVKRFPYYLYYQFLEAKQHVRVVAVMHTKCRPDYWRSRLNEPGAIS